MTITYQVTENELGGKNIIRIGEDGAMAAIPSDPANSDYQAYLASLEAQMDNVTFVIVDGLEHAIIDRGNEEFTSMPKATYDAQKAAQSTTPKAGI